MNVLIIAKNTQNWQLFTTWFTAYDQLVDSNISLCMTQSEETPFMLFQWAKRLKIPHLFCKNEFSDPIANHLCLAKKAIKMKFINEKSPLLILSDLMIVNNADFERILSLDENSGFIPEPQEIDELINKRMLKNFKTEHALSVEVKEKSEIHPIGSYKKGCGRWIDKLKGCPFSNAAGLATEDMTINEFLVIDSWKKMTPLYQAIA
jgi:hypothetical protein